MAVLLVVADILFELDGATDGINENPGLFIVVIVWGLVQFDRKILNFEFEDISMPFSITHEYPMAMVPHESSLELPALKIYVISFIAVNS